MKILALIPARGGSKRLPGKNIKLLGGIPLIAWTIRAALESKCCVDVLVSTDDQEIADVAILYGAIVPWLRPSELATDTAGSVDVALHALDAYEQAYGTVDGLMLLQPTCPFRQSKTIRQAVQVFLKNNRSTVVSVMPVDTHPAWCFHENDGFLVPVLGWNEVFHRSQDLSPVFALNGGIYLIYPATLRKERQLISINSVPIIMHNRNESIDIDSQCDWEFAESVMKEFM